METVAIASQFDMLHGGSRLSVFLYETDHPPETLSDPAYFLPVAGRLRRNDVILACAGAAKAPTWALLMVREIRPDAVRLEDLNAFQAARIGSFAMLRKGAGRLSSPEGGPSAGNERRRGSAGAGKSTRNRKKS